MSKGPGGSASSGRGTGAAAGGSGVASGSAQATQSAPPGFTSALTKAERSALEDYTGNTFAPINAYIRGKEKTLHPYVRKIMKNTESALDKTSLPRDMVLFRGIGGNTGAKLREQVMSGH